MILDEIAGYLTAQSTDFTALSGSAGNLTKAFMPDSSPAPDTIATVYETGGVAPAHTFSTGDLPDVAYENPRVQLIARSTSYTVARNLADTAFKLLDGLNGRSLPTSTGTPYIDIAAVQSPFSIGRDDNGRYLISVNFAVRKLVSGVVGDPGGFSEGFTGGFD